MTYDVPPQSGQPALTLPIGVTNTPQAVRAILEPPPPGELTTSPIGQVRYYNQVDMLITVTNGGFTVQSGLFNGFATTISSTNTTNFISTNGTFYDWRESKTVLPITINISNLVVFSTNTAAHFTNLLSLLGRPLYSFYVNDARTFAAGYLGAVRLQNGIQLPPLGLTVATMDPLYVQGHYNDNPAWLGTANVSTALPASLVGDAITILSTAWSDANSVVLEASRNAAATTVNAAILAGEMDTTAGHYSGGMENFPRFLENWGSGNIFTYNGSMIKMFPSLYATNVWGSTNVYNPPARNWTFDTNFENPMMLPPLTPSLQVVNRSQWASLAPNQTAAP